MVITSTLLIFFGVVFQIFEMRAREGSGDVVERDSSLLIPIGLILISALSLFVTQWIGFFIALLLFLFFTLLFLGERRISIYLLVGVLWYLLAIPLFSELLHVPLPEWRL